MRGYGKSTRARAITRPRARLLVHDPNREHEALRLEAAELLRYLEAEEHAHELDRFRLALITPGFETWFCAIAWELAQRIGRENELCLTVLLEEADIVAPPGREPWALKRLAAQGRHYGVEMIACSRRPAEVSRWLTASADELNVFFTHEPRDLAYLRSFMPPDAVAAVAELQLYQYVHWTPARWEKRELLDKTGRERTVQTSTSTRRAGNAESFDGDPGGGVAV